MIRTWFWWVKVGTTLLAGAPAYECVNGGKLSLTTCFENITQITRDYSKIMIMGLYIGI
jgi:hypothetical protein